MKVYISGPISGRDFMVQKDLFHRAEVCCRCEFGKDIEIFNPFVFCAQDDSKDWGDYMLECLPVLKKCDVVVLLPDWEQSKGASIEFDFAVQCNLKVFEMNPYATRDKYFISQIRNNYGMPDSPCNTDCMLYRLGNCSYAIDHIYECPSYAGYLKLIDWCLDI